MKKIKILVTLLSVIIFSIFLTSCGGGGGSSSGQANLKISIGGDVFTESPSRIAVNGYDINSLVLNVSNSGRSWFSDDILRSIEAAGFVNVKLDLNNTYNFSIEAFNSRNVSICSGETEAYVSKSADSITLSCDSLNAVIDISSVSGVVASGLPLSGKVYFKDVNGVVAETDIQPDGSYSIDVTGMTPPFIIKAVGVVGTKEVTMLSFSDGVVPVANVNPFTDLALSIATGGSDASDIFDNSSRYQSNLRNSQVTSALEQVNEIFAEFFASLGISDFDPMKGSYSADGTGADGVLDHIEINISGGQVAIVNKNTGESIAAGSVGSIGSTVISGNVVTEIVQYVNEGPAQLTEIKAFLNDYYINHSRGSFAAYLADDFTWHNGYTRQIIASNGSLPGTTEVYLDNIQVYKRISSSKVLAYFYVINSGGEKIPHFEWLSKIDGQWYKTGNGRMFQRDTDFISIRKSAGDGTLTNVSGIQFEAYDNAPQGIKIIVVNGPGLPAAGIRLIPGTAGFEIFSADRTSADNTNLYILSASQTTDINTAVSTSGAAYYTYTAYTDISSDSQPAGNPLASIGQEMRSKIATVSELSANPGGYFISSAQLTSHDIDSLSSGSTVTYTLTKPSNTILFGSAGYTCTDIYGGVYRSDTYLPMNSNSLSVQIPQTDFSYVESCTAGVLYVDAKLTKYKFQWEFVHTSSDTGTDPGTDPGTAPGTDAAAVIQEASDSVANNILTKVNDTGYVTENLDLPTNYGSGVTMTWSSSNTSVISNTGVVTRPSYGSGDASVILTLTVTYGSVTATESFTLIVPEESDPRSTVIDQIKSYLTASSLLNGNSDSDNIISALYLPSSVMSSETITWSSNNTSVISAEGIVTRPAYGSSDASVTLTASITYSGLTDTASFAFTVKSLTGDITGKADGGLALGMVALMDIYTGNMFPDEVLTSLDGVSDFDSGAISITTPVNMDGLYMISVVGGTFYDITGNQDAQPTDSRNVISAFIKGEDLVSGNFQINVLTDMISKSLSYFVASAPKSSVANMSSDTYISDALDQMALKLLKTSVDNDSDIDYDDILAFSIASDADKLLINDTYYQLYVAGITDGDTVFDILQEISGNLVRILNSGYDAFAPHISGNTLYFGDLGNGTTYYDIADPINAYETGAEMYDGAYAVSIASYGSTLYTLLDDQTLVIYDITDTNAPGNVQYVNTGAAGITQIEINSTDGSYIYMADPAPFFKVFDTAGKSVVGSNSSAALTGISFFDMDSTYTYAYTGSQTGDLFVLDVSDPGNITIANSGSPYSSQDGTGNDIALKNDCLFMATGNGVEIIDVSSPASPAYDSAIIAPEPATALKIDGDKLYVAYMYTGLIEVYDITDPFAPEKIYTAKTSTPFYETTITDMTIEGDYLYAATGMGIMMLDISQAGAPEVANMIRGKDSVNDVVKYGSYLYLATQNSQIETFDIQNPAKPVSLGNTNFDAVNNFVSVLTDGAYLFAQTQFSFHGIDLSDPENISNEYYDSLSNSAGYKMFQNGTDIAVTDGSDILLYNISDTASIILGDTFNANSSVNGIFSEGSYIYAVESNGNLSVFELGNSPDPLTSLTIFESAESITGADGYLYVFDSIGDLTSLDLIYPDDPAVAGGVSTNPSFYITDMAADGDFLYAAAESGVLVFDISTPEIIKEIAFYPTPNNASKVYLNGSYVYAADEYGGVIMLPKLNNKLVPLSANFMQMIVGGGDQQMP